MCRIQLDFCSACESYYIEKTTESALVVEGNEDALDDTYLDASKFRETGMSARQPATRGSIRSHIESQLGSPQIPWAHCDIVDHLPLLHLMHPDSYELMGSPRIPITKPRSSIRAPIFVLLYLLMRIYLQKTPS